MNLLGLGVVFYQVIFIDSVKLKGQGTALLLVGASLLFAVVFSTWDWNNNRLAAFASFSTAVFGFLGTSYILADENPLLLTLLGVIAFYSVGVGLLFAFTTRLVVRRIQDEMTRRSGNR